MDWQMSSKEITMHTILNDIFMTRTNDTSIKAINEWFRLLSKREKLIVLAMHNTSPTEDYQKMKNVELVLMANVSPKRRYEENGAPCSEYPSFDEIRETDLISLWNFLLYEEKLVLFARKSKSVC